MGSSSLSPDAALPMPVLGRKQTGCKRAIYIAALVIGLATLLVHMQSYWWCQSLTLCDLRIDCDQGLVAIEIPLTRLTPTGKLTTNFTLYRWGQNSWKFWPSGEPGKAAYRYWMTLPVVVRGEGVLVADFGYWLGGWQSESRPGRFIFFFLPVWFAGLLAFGVFLLFYYRLIRFRLRTLFLVITFWAVILGLLSLRSS